MIVQTSRKHVYRNALELLEMVRSDAYAGGTFSAFAPGDDERKAAHEILKIIKQLAMDFDDDGSERISK